MTEETIMSFLLFIGALGYIITSIIYKNKLF